MQQYNLPPEARRRRKTNKLGCTCDCSYAKSLQGICKIIQLCLLGLAWIVIAASPYWRPIFVMGGTTWPFHVVMLLSILPWLAVLGMFCLFISGYHLSRGHKNWPKIELWFNVAMCIIVLIAACIEAANVWRWDMSRGSILTGGASYQNYYQYGLRPGMSFTQTLNFQSYCVQRPYDCSDYFSLLAGNSSYYANHLFAVVLLFFSVIAFLVSTFFAYRTWRVFERDMHRPGEIPKPTMWMRFTYQMGKAGDRVRDRAGKVFKPENPDEEEDEDDGKDVVFEEAKKTMLDAEAGFDDEKSHRSDGRSSRARSHASHHASRSHHSHHDDRSKSRNSHRRDENGSSLRHEGSERSSRHHSEHERSSRSRSSSEHRSRSSSKPMSPSYEEAPLTHPQPVGAFPALSHKEGSERSSRHHSGRERSSRSSSEHRSRSSLKPMSPHLEVPPSYEEAPLTHPQPVGAFPVLSHKKGSKKEKKGAPVETSPVASVMI